jgi:hypothetical protein
METVTQQKDTIKTTGRLYHPNDYKGYDLVQGQDKHSVSISSDGVITGAVLPSGSTSFSNRFMVIPIV